MRSEFTDAQGLLLLLLAQISAKDSVDLRENESRDIPANIG